MRLRSCGVVLALLTVVSVPMKLGPAMAQESETGAAPAAEALSATIDVERSLLKENLDRREHAAAGRARISARLLELYAELDAAVKRTDAQAPKAVEDARARLAPLESERSELVLEDDMLLDRIQERQHKIRLLEERMASLQGRVQEDVGLLTGRWEVVLLPTQQKGTFSLVHNGTLINGTYQLEGGWTGSLQGTLVNRKVHLERIDSKLGRSAEFEGYLSGDGSRIRGSWRSYELSAQDLASGQWSATRKAQAP